MINKQTRKKIYKTLGPLYRIMVNIISIFDTKFQYSYSQEGEDLILKNLFRNKNTGFYVDVGAFHPYIFSNTYLFYRLGWHGINIDAMPGSMNIFKKKRHRDINIEAAISDTNKKLILNQFNEPALNTFSEKLANEIKQKQKFQLIGQVEVYPKRLEAILNEFVPEGQNIDFLSIDVEGYEIEVLKSNDWQKFRPTVILVEKLDSSIVEILKTDLHSFLTTHHYYLYSKTLNTLFYLDESFKINSYE